MSMLPLGRRAGPSSRVENSLQQQAAKAKLAAQSVQNTGAIVQRRPALKDLTNTAATGAAGRVAGRKVAKLVGPAPKVLAVKPAVKRPAESDLEPMEIDEELLLTGATRTTVDDLRATKKRKSEPESDPMLIDEMEDAYSEKDSMEEM